MSLTYTLRGEVSAIFRPEEGALFLFEYCVLPLTK